MIAALIMYVLGGSITYEMICQEEPIERYKILIAALLWPIIALALLIINIYDFWIEIP